MAIEGVWYEIFFQELFSSFLLFIFFVPIPNTYSGWIQHFIALVLFDIPKGIANPAVLYALWIKKDISARELIIRLISNLISAFFGYHLVQLIYPTLHLVGPTLQTNFYAGFLIEFALGYLLMMIVLFSANSSTLPPAVWVAVGVRVLLFLEGGSYTGASMNPLFAIGWEIYRDYSGLNNGNFYDQSIHCLQFLLVYAIAPTLGACTVTLFLSKKEATRSQKKEKVI